MKDVNDSLENFSRIVLEKAFKIRDDMEDDLKKRTEKTMEEKENFYLEEAYRKIQAGKSKIIQEVNKNISKVKLEGKKELIIKRNEIIEEVFNNIIIRIKEFIDSDNYYEWLFNKIKGSVKTIADDNDILININKTDEKHVNDLENDLNDYFKTKQIKVCIIPDNDIIGGAVILGKSKNFLINISIKEKMKDVKGQFLKQSKMTVE